MSLNFNPNLLGRGGEAISAIALTHTLSWRVVTPPIIVFPSLPCLSWCGGGLGTMLTGYHPPHELQVRRISSLLPTTVATRSNGASLAGYQHDTRPLWHQKVHLAWAFTPPPSAHPAQLFFYYLSSPHTNTSLLSLFLFSSRHIAFLVLKGTHLDFFFGLWCYLQAFHRQTKT